jgi:hypothetical protein
MIAARSMSQGSVRTLGFSFEVLNLPGSMFGRAAQQVIAVDKARFS